MNAAKIEARRVKEIAERGIAALQGRTGPAAHYHANCANLATANHASARNGPVGLDAVACPGDPDDEC